MPIAAIPALNKRGVSSLLPARVERYRRGKAPLGPDGKPINDVESDDSDDEDNLGVSSQNEDGNNEENKEISIKKVKSNEGFSKDHRKHQIELRELRFEENECKSEVKLTKVEVDYEKLRMDPRIMRLQEFKNNQSSVSQQRRYVSPERVKDGVSSALENSKITTNDEINRRVMMNNNNESNYYDLESYACNDDEDSSGDYDDLNNKLNNKNKSKNNFNDDDDENSDNDNSTTTESISALDDYIKPQQARLKPVFIPRDARGLSTNEYDGCTTTSRDTEQMEKRRIESRSLLEEEIRREEVSRTAIIGLGAQDVDDADITDDDESEYMLWRERELARLQRDYEIRRALELERNQVENRRKNTTAAEWAADEERVRKEVLEAAKSKPRVKFLQKYYHKGAFYHEDGGDLLTRSYQEATLEDHFNREALPEILQKRNFGKSGQSKWTHLTKEDTSSKDSLWYADRNLSKKMVKMQGGGFGNLDNPKKK